MLSKRILPQINSTLSFRMQNARWATAVASKRENLVDSTVLANAKPFEQLPSFHMLPLLGTAWIYLPLIGYYKIKEQHKASEDKRRRFGNIFREKIGTMNLVFSYNADDMQVLFQNEGPYPSRGEFSSLKAYRESRKYWYTTSGVAILQGKAWHDLRSKTQKHLMKPRAIQAFIDPMQDVARDFVTKIYDSRNSNYEVPNFLNEIYKWALESVAMVGLDTRLGCLDRHLSAKSDGMRMINSVQTQFECMSKLEAIAGNVQFWKLFPTPTWKRFTAAGDTFTEIAFKYINRSLKGLKKNAENDDKEVTLLQSMLMEKGLDVSGAMVTVADMLTAGIDTTSHSVGFFLYNIAKNPEKQERLYQEITKFLPNKEDRITPEILEEFKYLKACIKESHRLNPIVPGAARLIDHDFVFSGYRIPAGTIAIVALHPIYIDERYYTNPEQYLPERWLNKDEKFHPFAFAPFGLGVRSCLGRRLAELEILCVTVELIRNFKITYKHEDIGMVFRLINTPDKPLRFNFLER